MTADTVRGIAGSGSESQESEPKQVAAAEADRDEENEGPRLVITLHDQVFLDRRLDSGRFLIGREEDNDICLPGRHVSRRHAMLNVDEAQATLIDLNSTNGVHVDSSRTPVIALRDGLTARVGEYRLTYICAKTTGRSSSSVTARLERRRTGRIPLVSVNGGRMESAQGSPAPKRPH